MWEADGQAVMVICTNLVTPMAQNKKSLQMAICTYIPMLHTLWYKLSTHGETAFKRLHNPTFFPMQPPHNVPVHFIVWAQGQIRLEYHIRECDFLSDRDLWSKPGSVIWRLSDSSEKVGIWQRVYLVQISVICSLSLTWHSSLTELTFFAVSDL